MIGMFSDGMFSDGTFSYGMFSDGTFSDGTFCMRNKEAIAFFLQLECTNFQRFVSCIFVPVLCRR